MKRICLAFLAGCLLALGSRVSTADGVDHGINIIDPIGREEVRLTVQKSPVLYYWISRVVPVPIHFTLRDSRTIRPVIETTIESPPVPGFWPIRLDEYHIVLEEDVQ